MSDLIISGIFDGPLPGGNPKVIELFALNNIPDLSLYGVGVANNGGGSDGQEISLSGSASAGQYIYISQESAEFQNFFGFLPDFIGPATTSFNGNDAVELFMNLTVVDVFGDIGVDGTGEAWDYLDGWAYRVSNTAPDGDTFNINNWIFSGINVLDGETSNATAAVPFPLGSFSSTASNTPPTTTDTDITLTEDAIYVFSSGDFAFTDSDGDALQGIRVTTLPARGQFFLDADMDNVEDIGEAVALNQVVTLAGINQLKYGPTANANSLSYDSFDYQVNDGTEFSSGSGTLTVNVTAVNDAPVLINDTTFTAIAENIADIANVGNTVTELIAGLVTDADFDPLGIAVTNVDDTNGTWEFSIDGGSTWQAFGGGVSENNAATLGASSLYTFTGGTAPDQQGQLSYTTINQDDPFGIDPTEPVATDSVELSGILVDTIADFNIYAGYSNYTSNPFSPTPVDAGFPALDSTSGYSVSFNMQLLEESRTNQNRAGFSLIVTSEDFTKAIELGFQKTSETTGNIFAQGEGANLFLAQENVAFNTNEATQYTLSVLGNSYQLLANGTQILTGALRDYSAFAPPLGIADPYELSSHIFLGDNTTSARGRFLLGQVAVETETRVRFVPDANYTGDATIQFRAWDTTDGSLNGDLLGDATQNGGAAAFSDNLVTGTITVNAANAAPTALTLQNVVTTLAENTDTSARIKVADIVITDDALGTNTVSLSGSDAASFEIDGTELYLKAGTALNFQTQPSFTITVAVDDTTVGGTPDLSQAFTLTITDVNSAPSLTGNAVLAAIAEDNPAPLGDTIVNLFSSIFADADVGATLSGVAIVGNTTNPATEGRWQYSTDGTTWLAVGAVADDNTALALSSATRLRFLTAANYSGTPFGLTVRALDNTYAGGFSGAGRVTVDTQANGGASAISATTSTLSTVVSDAPEVIRIDRRDANPTTAPNVTFDVTFSEAVTGVDATDFAIAGTVAGTVASVSGAGNSYVVTVNGLSGTGSLGLNLADNDSITNLGGITLGGIGTNGSGNGSFIGQGYTIESGAIIGVTPQVFPLSPPVANTGPVWTFRQFVQYQAIDDGRPYQGQLALNTMIDGLAIADLFDETDYLARNPDVAQAVLNGQFTYGFEHFLVAGMNEGRNPSRYFDEAYYLAKNADVKAAVERGNLRNGLIHFLTFGHRENRNPGKLFNSRDYLLANPDVRAAVNISVFTSAFEHYIEFGASEGRSSHLLFQEQYYLRRNPDVANAVRANQFASGFEHFISFGQKERRQPSPFFNESAYLNRDPLVAAAIGEGGFSSGLEHYIYYGRAEGRDTL